MRKILAVLTGKLIFAASRYLKIGGGTAAPGLYALKICPDLVEKLSKNIPVTVVITGTNGKTTTARMLSHFAKNQKLKVLRNSAGSNLERGIASALISDYQLLTTNYQPDLAIWELDEAAFNRVAEKVKPDIVVFLNVFRDQLDRYGEVDTVVKKWSQTVAKLPSKTTILLNTDDHNLLELKKNFKGKILTFGVKHYKIKGEKITRQKEVPSLDVEALDIETQSLAGTKFNLSANKELWEISIPLPGIYNIYNFLAAFGVALSLKWPIKFFGPILEDFSPAFGRMEKVSLEKGEAVIFLIKNPAGATQVFQTIKDSIKEGDRLLFALNDNLADGTDVSWIWDAQFELLATNYQLSTICSGSRAQDLGLRLKYAGFKPEALNTQPNLETAFETVQKGLEGHLYILPTYTSLLKLEKILASKGLKKPYWEES